jgi:hypothetical protein
MKLPQAPEKLAELEVACNIFGMGFKEFLEVADRGRIVSQLDALERQSVARKRVAGLRGEEFFEHFAA